MNPPAYAVIGATGNCGTALIENLLRHRQDVRIHAYCRNRSKLIQKLANISSDADIDKRMDVFVGSIHDSALLAKCISGCRAIFLVVSTNDNIPGCRLSRDIAETLIAALQNIRQQQPDAVLPKIVLLSSSTLDDHLSRHLPYWLKGILVRSASNVYRDLAETEKMLRSQSDWLTCLYAKPGMLSVDIQRGHAIMVDEHNEDPLSYLDLAAAMIEAVDDPAGKYDNGSFSVVNTGGPATFPSGNANVSFDGPIAALFSISPSLPAY